MKNATTVTIKGKKITVTAASDLGISSEMLTIVCQQADDHTGNSLNIETLTEYVASEIKSKSFRAKNWIRTAFAAGVTA